MSKATVTSLILWSAAAGLLETHEREYVENSITRDERVDGEPVANCPAVGRGRVHRRDRTIVLVTHEGDERIIGELAEDCRRCTILSLPDPEPTAGQVSEVVEMAESVAGRALIESMGEEIASLKASQADTNRLLAQLLHELKGTPS